jgi:hypothetical protein
MFMSVVNGKGDVYAWYEQKRAFFRSWDSLKADRTQPLLASGAMVFSVRIETTAPEKQGKTNRSRS